jgi:hypothetical protein
VKTLPGTEHNRSEAKFTATYKILEPICGAYKGNQITFDYVSWYLDSSFKTNKYVLLILMKDKDRKARYELRGGMFNDLFKTVDGKWAAPYATKVYTDYTSEGTTAVRPEKIEFAKEAYYNIKGWMREEIDINYPEPYYKYEDDKAIPVCGNYVPEIFQLQKDGLLTSWEIYGTHGSGIVSMVDTSSYASASIQSVTVEDVESEEIQTAYFDSVNLEINKTLLTDPFNETAIRNLIDNCRRRGNYDNCSLFFENLTQKYPDSIRAYLVKAKLRHPRPNLEDSSKINVLKQALKIDSSSYEANYELAICYYDLFRTWPNSLYAYNATKYFIKAANIDTTQLFLLKNLVIQLSKYLGDTVTEKKYKEYYYHVKTNKQGVPTGNLHNWYFPIDPLLELRPNLVEGKKFNWIQELKWAVFTLDWFSEILLLLNEPVISDGYKNDTYRFLLLRSFDVPVVIRMEKSDGKVSIYWKKPLYNQQLDKYEPVTEVEKNLTLNEWNEFERLLTAIDYWNMVSRDYHPSRATHGDEWILEAAVNGRYKLTERGSDIRPAYPKYQKCLEYLISLTDLSVDKR